MMRNKAVEYLLASALIGGSAAAAAQTAPGTGCPGAPTCTQIPNGTGGTARAEANAIVNAAKGRAFQGLGIIGGAAMAPDATDACMKTLGILGVYSAGNVGRDDDATVACREKEAATRIGLVALQHEDQTMKAMGVRLLSKIFTQITAFNDSLTEVTNKLAHCVDKNRGLADHWANILSDRDTLYCSRKTFKEDRDEAAAALAAQRAHELALARASAPIVKEAPPAACVIATAPAPATSAFKATTRRKPAAPAPAPKPNCPADSAPATIKPVPKPDRQ